MIISYCVQATRYTIQEALGCAVAIYPDLYAILGLYVPPLLIGIVSFGYGGTSPPPVLLHYTSGCPY
jgi:hypothetical protein